MSTEAYDWARDERLAWIERENDVARGLAGYTDSELRRVHRVSDRLLRERGFETREDEGGRMLGIAMLCVLTYAFGLATSWIVIASLQWAVSQ